MDPLAVHLAMGEAVEHMRRGRGPTVVEVDTYRFFHQNGGFAGSAFGYRDKEEETAWRERDPLDADRRPPRAARHPVGRARPPRRSPRPRP